MQERRATTRRSRNGRSSSIATARRSRCGRSSSSSRPACRASRTCRASRAWRRSRAMQHHSSQHTGGEDYRGKKCVVIGSNNSAHDICADLWEHGADVTMVQRTSTHVARSDTLMELALGAALLGGRRVADRHHHRQGRPDLRLAALPDHARRSRCPVYEEMARRDADFYERLEQGRLHARFRRGRLGPVHEIPAARLGLLHRCRRLRAVADGKIKLKSGVDGRSRSRSTRSSSPTAPSCPPT